MMAKDKRFHKNYINISKEKFAFIPPIILSVILSQTKKKQIELGDPVSRINHSKA